MRFFSEILFFKKLNTERDVNLGRVSLLMDLNGLFVHFVYGQFYSFVPS
jgi:hypothetical protein